MVLENTGLECVSSCLEFYISQVLANLMFVTCQLLFKNMSFYFVVVVVVIMMTTPVRSRSVATTVAHPQQCMHITAIAIAT